MNDKTLLRGRASLQIKSRDLIVEESRPVAQSTEARSPQQIRFAVNPHGKDKTWDYEKLATGYQDKTGSLQDFANHIKQGHAVCAGLLGGQRRTKANVIGSQVAMLDIDNSAPLLDTDGQPVKGEDGKSIKVYDPQLTLDQAIAHLFIQQHCSLIYTSASHKPDPFP